MRFSNARSSNWLLILLIEVILFFSYSNACWVLFKKNLFALLNFQVSFCNTVQNETVCFNDPVWQVSPNYPCRVSFHIQNWKFAYIYIFLWTGSTGFCLFVFPLKLVRTINVYECRAKNYHKNSYVARCYIFIYSQMSVINNFSNILSNDQRNV